MMMKFKQVLGIAYIQSRFVRRQPLWIMDTITWTVGFIITIVAWGGIENFFEHGCYISLF